MTVEVRERSLSTVSNVIGLNFASSVYKALRSISAKHHGNRLMNSPSIFDKQRCKMLQT